MATATAQIATRVVVGEGGVVKEERDRSSRPRRGSSLTENPLQLSSPEKKLAAAPVPSACAAEPEPASVVTAADDNVSWRMR